jgi:hypothetical protein
MQFTAIEETGVKMATLKQVCYYLFGNKKTIYELINASIVVTGIENAIP